MNCPAVPRDDTHFIPNINPAEAEGAELGVGILHGGLDHLAEQFLHELADVGPHLSHRLQEHMGKAKQC